MMNEEFVKNNSVMFFFLKKKKNVKNIVMNARIDPNVVMELSVFQIGGWNHFQPSKRNLLED